MWHRKEEILWTQARVDFLKHSDSNARWFRARAVARMVANQIKLLIDHNGVECKEDSVIEQVVAKHFKDLFTSSNPHDLAVVLQHVQPRVTPAMNTSLIAPYSVDEVFTALNQMHPNKAPSSDGLNTSFFQHLWDVIGHSITSVVLDILNGAPIPFWLNHKIMVLIPKKPNPPP